jgi:two-component system, cell cycle response regulator CtrA
MTTRTREEQLLIENEALRRANARQCDRIRALEAQIPPPVAVPAAWGLTRMEGRVLEILMRREEVSRDAIMDALYGNNPDPPFEKVIDVYVTKIRRKVAPFGVKVLSKWGFGYFISPEHRGRLRQLAVEASGRTFTERSQAA